MFMDQIISWHGCYAEPPVDSVGVAVICPTGWIVIDCL